MHNPGDGMVCGRCGVELLNGSADNQSEKRIRGDIQADQSGLEYVYRDAGGCLITSFSPLPCPVFIGNKPGNMGGAIMMDRVKIREVTKKVYDMSYRVEGTEERIARLERENEVLREAIQQPIDATRLVEFLAEMVSAAIQAKMRMVPVLVEGKPYALPEPVANVIIDIAAQPEKEGVPVRVREVEVESDD